jgi:hypothetical protein
LGATVAVFEADDASTVLEGVTPFTPFFEFTVTPVIDVQDAVPVYMKVNSWRDSIA